MAEKQKVRLIVVDGPSGAGKDTLIEALAAGLSSRRSHVFQLSEDKLDPDRDAIKRARELGKSRGGTGDREMAAEITAHRAQIYQQVLLPLTREHLQTIVIANRGLPATLAYQTLRGEISMEEVWNEHQRQRIPNPDLVVITSCRPEIAQQREDRRNFNGVGLSGGVTKEAGASLEETIRRRNGLHQNFRRAAEFLAGKNVRVIEIDTETLTVQEEKEIVLRDILLRSYLQ